MALNIKNNIPSIISEYYSYEKTLLGFTLAYSSFFKQFKLSKDLRHLTWNSKIVIFDIEYPNSIDFINEQQRWILSSKIQELYVTNPDELKKECQRRINFFVNFLHEKAGELGTNGGGWDGKLSPIIADIRYVAYNCLQ